MSVELAELTRAQLALNIAINLNEACAELMAMAQMKAEATTLVGAPQAHAECEPQLADIMDKLAQAACDTHFLAGRPQDTEAMAEACAAWVVGV